LRVAAQRSPKRDEAAAGRGGAGVSLVERPEDRPERLASRGPIEPGELEKGAAVCAVAGAERPDDMVACCERGGHVGLLGYQDQHERARQVD
jgi:hypothetical protein